ncbi:hypothetical protein QJS10_CPA03g01112 [Acorus calamus]|uniref:Uncharacterized protein n=1 Tax=Acorus calamus TaxID=4465 RepID=A0AAV9F5U7_ACOCL|nr:hypothetical protein QJS10_CPA03g01112 [Acorus calamus]
MAFSGSSLAFLVAALLATALFMEGAGAAYDRLHSVKPEDDIGYGAIGRDGIPCSAGSHQEANCKPTPVNPPTRGCQPVDRCRGDGPPADLKA